MQTYPPGTRIGQYEIASLPMMGGMGVVYFALDHGNDGRPVALKTFRPEFLPDRAARDRFLREGATWIELGSHPHIVRCYKVEYIDPTAFLVLEPIAKEQNMPDASLRSWLIPGRPLPLEQALLFALQIARGMQYASEKIPGFVHRDLKPENILVGTDRLPGTEVNRLRVTDFGLVKTIAGSGILATVGKKEELKLNQVQFTQEAGTPLYMAPEQWKGEPVGVFTDVYAFGCILYEMLSGQQAAEGKNITELRISHLDGRLQPIPRNLPESVMALVGKCLALNPMDRFSVWSAITDSLKSVYFMQCGKSVSEVTTSDAINRAEKMQLSWSYNAIGMSYLDMGKAERATHYFESAVAIARQINDRGGESANVGSLGNAYFNLGDVQRAVGYYDQALTIAREVGSRGGEGLSLGDLGVAYAALGKIQQAIICYEQALAIAQGFNDLRWIGRTLTNIGLAYATNGEARQAINYYEQALAILREAGDRRTEGITLGYLGNEYSKLGEPQQSISYNEAALAIAREIGDRRGEGTALGNLGNAYKVLGEEQQEISYHMQAINIDREIGNIHGVANSSFNIALSYAQHGDIFQALPLAQEAEQIFARINTPELQNAKKLVTLLQEDINKYAVRAQEALEIVGLADSLEDVEAAVNRFPFITNSNFLDAFAKVIDQAPSHLKPEFERCMTWLRQIANQK